MCFFLSCEDCTFFSSTFVSRGLLLVVTFSGGGGGGGAVGVIVVVGCGVDGVKEMIFLMFHHLFIFHVVAHPARLDNGNRRILIKHVSCT